MRAGETMSNGNRAHLVQLPTYVACRIKNDYYDHNRSGVLLEGGGYGRSDVDGSGGEGKIQRIDRQGKVGGAAENHETWSYDGGGRCARGMESESGAKRQLSRISGCFPLARVKT